MPDFPEMTEFPEDGGAVGNASMPGECTDALGILAAQNGDNYYEILVHMFPGPTPMHGSLVVNFDAESARQLANHLLRLAEFAEIGEPAAQVDG